MKPYLIIISAFAAGACLADGSPSAVTSAWSSVTCIDTRADSVRFAKSNAPVAYAPRYSGGSAVDHVVLRAVQYAGTDYAVTNVIETCAAGAEGGKVMGLSPGAERCYRLLHTACDANGAAVGETLAADVSIAVTGEGAAETLVDTRENALQLVADELAEKGGGTVPFAYSTDWVTNGTPASVRISCVCDINRRDGRLLSSETNILLSASAPAAGDLIRAIEPDRGGRYTFFCSFLDAAGDALGDELTATYGFPVKFGLVFILK